MKRIEFLDVEHTGRDLLRAVPVALAVAGAALLPDAAQARGPSESSVAEIVVTFEEDCSAGKVTSSKDLSNIVIVLSDGSFEKFEDFGDGVTEADLVLADDAEGVIQTVYVKSGSFKTGKVEGVPGQVGRQFDCA